MSTDAIVMFAAIALLVASGLAFWAGYRLGESRFDSMYQLGLRHGLQLGQAEWRVIRGGKSDSEVAQ